MTRTWERELCLIPTINADIVFKRVGIVNTDYLGMQVVIEWRLRLTIDITPAATEYEAFVLWRSRRAVDVFEMIFEKPSSYLLLINHN